MFSPDKYFCFLVPSCPFQMRGILGESGTKQLQEQEAQERNRNSVWIADPAQL